MGDRPMGDRRARLAAERAARSPLRRRTDLGPALDRLGRSKSKSKSWAKSQVSPHAATAASGNELELDVTRPPVRGRRAATPTDSRRRLELALGRALGHRGAWGAGIAGIAVVLVLLLANSSLLDRGVTIADRGLPSDGPSMKAVQPVPGPAEPTTAPSAVATTKSAAKATAPGRARTRASDQPQRRTHTTTTPGDRSLPAGSMAGLSDAASGLGWASGVFVPGGGPSAVKAFGAWRGAGMDLATDWSARQTWTDIINPTWLYDEWKNTPYTLALGVAPIPEGDASATMAGCASGEYNDKWRQYARNIKAAGLDDRTVVRLGWEFNGNWYKWAATNPSQFAECWRQIVATVKKIAPKLTWDWNVNRGEGQSVTDARKAYPGDAYVDLIGIDSYDQYPGARTESEWQQQYSGAYGLKFWADFAAAHHKKFTVPEWGVYPGNGGNSGGDNAFYIAKMVKFFTAQGGRLAYESYFNESSSYIAASLFGPNQNPAAAAKYKALMSH